MKKQFRFVILIILPFLFSFAARSQNLSPVARISLLTASPGEELYSVFGHSALRVHDPVNGIDEVYNYGTFDFQTPFFYYKFLNGQLLYQLSVSTYENFLLSYHYEGRAVYEQILNLSQKEMQDVYAFLLINRLPQNKSYLYDFFYDNCSTRIRDLVENFLAPDWGTQGVTESGVTFRGLLKPYLDHTPWSGFGIDLVLGLPSDKQATYWERMFLPDELFQAFAQARLPDGRLLVERHQVVLEKRIDLQGRGEQVPIIVSWIILFVGAALLFRPRLSLLFDRIFFLLLGLAGLIIFFLWFISEHHATDYNLNLLWTLPTHLYFIFKTGLNKSNAIARYYFRFNFIINILFILAWWWMPQDLHPSFLPLIILSAVKSFYYGFGFNKKTVRVDQI